MWQSLILDAHVMTYPPSSLCTGGTEEVQRYLCSGMVSKRSWQISFQQSTLQDAKFNIDEGISVQWVFC